MSNFFGGEFFGGGFFGEITGPPSGGKGDNRIFKPTGLLDRPTRKTEAVIEQRLDEQVHAHAEIAGQLAREFAEESNILRRKEVALMTAQEVDREIGVLIRKREEDDEVLLLLLLVAAHER